MNADGSDPKQVTDTTADEAFPSWSPDGTRIAYQSGADIWIMNADGSEPREVVKNGTGPTWSADGLEIAFAALEGTATDLAIVQVDTGIVRALVETPDVAEAYPAWSPDGSQIAYFGNPGNHPGIYSVDADGGESRQITTADTFDFYPAWSPDGTRIVYAFPHGPQGLAVIGADGNSRVELSTTETYDSFPTWSPDGCCIAFLSTRVDGQSDIFVMRADGSGVRRLTETPTEEGAYGIDWKP